MATFITKPQERSWHEVLNDWIWEAGPTELPGRIEAAERVQRCYELCNSGKPPDELDLSGLELTNADIMFPPVRRINLNRNRIQSIQPNPDNFKGVQAVTLLYNNFMFNEEWLEMQKSMNVLETRCGINFLTPNRTNKQQNSNPPIISPSLLPDPIPTADWKTVLENWVGQADPSERSGRRKAAQRVQRCYARCNSGNPPDELDLSGLGLTNVDIIFPPVRRINLNFNRILSMQPNPNNFKGVKAVTVLYNTSNLFAEGSELRKSMNILETQCGIHFLLPDFGKQQEYSNPSIISPSRLPDPIPTADWNTVLNNWIRQADGPEMLARFEAGNRIRMCYFLCSPESSPEELDLSNLGLTNVDLVFPPIERINLSGNNIRSINVKPNAFEKVKEIILIGNPICQEMGQLQTLKRTFGDLTIFTQESETEIERCKKLLKDLGL